MTLESLAAQASQNKADIAAVLENCKSAHKRIDENDRIIDGIHRLAVNLETLALQVKLQGERLDAGLRGTESRLSDLEKKPAKRWEAVVGQVIGLAVAGLVGLMFAKLL